MYVTKVKLNKVWCNKLVTKKEYDLLEIHRKAEYWDIIYWISKSSIY